MTPAYGTDLDDLMVSPRASILDVMKTIDRTGLEVALVCDENRKLLSVITDGDIRRALIKGADLTSCVADGGSNDFKFSSPQNSRAEAVDIMVNNSIKCLPIIDMEGRFVGLHTLQVSLLNRKCESWAVIMAGGKGERLGELTNAIPKPMLPVGDRPILERIIQLLISHGIRRIFISVNYLARMIQDYFGDGSRYHCRIEYLHETKALGTGGALSLLPEVPKASVLLINGDLLTNLNLTRFLEFHEKGGHHITAALRDHSIQVPFGVADVEGSRISRLREKPVLSYQINAGIYAIVPDALELIPRDLFFPVTKLIDICLEKSLSVGGYHIQETWKDIGLPEEYWNAQKLVE